MRKLLKVSAVCIIIFCIYLIHNHFTFDFYYTKGEKDGDPVISPNGSYSAQIYYENYGGAAGGVNLIVNVTSHLEDDFERTVYFGDAKGSVRLKWLEEDLLSITNFNEYGDRSAELIIGEEIYDETGRACSAYRIKKNYVCYSLDFIKNN